MDNESRRNAALYDTLVLTLECRVANLSHLLSGRTLVDKGRRFDLELETRSSEGMFISAIEKCDRPLSHNEEGTVVLRAAIPKTYSASFVEGSRVKLRDGQYVIADCRVVKAERAPS